MKATQMQASGTIQPCRFIKVSGNNTVAAAGANEEAIGISFNSTRPPTASSPTAHCISGEPCAFHPIGSNDVLLEIGTGGCTYGDRLIAESGGKGVVAATTGTTRQNIGAIAMRAGAAGEFVPVIIVNNTTRPALS